MAFMRRLTPTDTYSQRNTALRLGWQQKTKRPQRQWAQWKEVPPVPMDVWGVARAEEAVDDKEEGDEELVAASLLALAGADTFAKAGGEAGGEAGQEATRTMPSPAQE